MAMQIIAAFLKKAPVDRLGTGRDGLNRIQSQPFFTPSIDWPRLEMRQLPAPFVPEVANETDSNYVPQTYLNTAAEDSIDPQAQPDTNKVH